MATISWSDLLKNAVLLAWNNKPYVMGVIVAATVVLSCYVHVPPQVYALEAALTGAGLHSSIKSN